MKPEILICECNSSEHQMIIRKLDDTIYCNIFLANSGFFSRLKRGIKYIFGYKCKYGHFDEFMFKEEDVNLLINKIK